MRIINRIDRINIKSSQSWWILSMRSHVKAQLFFAVVDVVFVKYYDDVLNNKQDMLKMKKRVKEVVITDFSFFMIIKF